MPLGQTVRRKAREAVPPLLFLSLVAYFGWQATRGDHGLKAYAMREQQLTTVRAEQAQAEAERDAWQRKVGELGDSHLDRDMLDERARAMLNRADPLDVVVPYGGGRKLF